MGVMQMISRFCEIRCAKITPLYERQYSSIINRSDFNHISEFPLPENDIFDDTSKLRKWPLHCFSSQGANG
jgi:hypothetical protein